ncbi:hypothetical protein F5Y18DRAFT_426224 [Xylariaceae sp. FL1019]|nr:hypothetical protein F5Y18DRAFT_426224 [Xylariaceae sp. FL1019]
MPGAIRMPKATGEELEKYRSVIVSLYLGDHDAGGTGGPAAKGLTLIELANQLKAQDGLHASAAQLELRLKKWQTRKNLKPEEWKLVFGRLESLPGGTKSRVLISGRPIPHSTVSRARRYFKERCRDVTRRTAGSIADDTRLPPQVSIEVKAETHTEWAQVSDTGNMIAAAESRMSVGPIQTTSSSSFQCPTGELMMGHNAISSETARDCTLLPARRISPVPTQQSELSIAVQKASSAEDRRRRLPASMIITAKGIESPQVDMPMLPNPSSAATFPRGRGQRVLEPEDEGTTSSQRDLNERLMANTEENWWLGGLCIPRKLSGTGSAINSQLVKCLGTYDHPLFPSIAHQSIPINIRDLLDSPFIR